MGRKLIRVFMKKARQAGLSRQTILALLSVVVIATMIMTGCSSTTSTSTTVAKPPTSTSSSAAAVTSTASTAVPAPSATAKPSGAPPATSTAAALPTQSTPAAPSGSPQPVPAGYKMVSIPAGSFDRGDHFEFDDPKHPSDENVRRILSISAFNIGNYDISNKQYCDYLNDALAQKQITVGPGQYLVVGSPKGYLKVDAGLVFLTSGNKDMLFLSRTAYKYSPISWDGSKFAVVENRENHPVTGVTWYGAAAYCNWLSQKEGYQNCYDQNGWGTYLNRNGYRLPTEAEWEYAGRGGQYNPYTNYPWGTVADKTYANWPKSGDPWETGPAPNTTPNGFYDGTLKKKSDYNWPGSMETYQTGNGANPWGIYDMSGNVWQWSNDWYRNEYYGECPLADPPGPEFAKASSMPDGLFYRGLRGGVWFNGDPDKFNGVDNGHGRLSNRDPAYYLGNPDDFTWAQCGFRVIRRDAQKVDQEVAVGKDGTQPAWHLPSAPQAKPAPPAAPAASGAQTSASAAQPKPSAPAAGGGGAAPAPSITAISPSSGPAAGGTVVTISGNGLGGGIGTVTFGGVAATAINQVGDPPSYQCTTPAHAAGAVDVVITTGGGAGTKTSGFTYN